MLCKLDPLPPYLLEALPGLSEALTNRASTGHTVQEAHCLPLT